MTRVGANREHDMASALLTMSSVWLWLLLTPFWSGWLGEDGALVFAFSVAAAGVLATGPRPNGLPNGPAALVGLAAGFLGLAAWIGTVVVVGLALGLPPREATPPMTGTVAAWIATVGVAPLLEEFLYRERLLLPLQDRLGTVAAVLLTSSFFAVSHIEVWSILGTFLIGAALAGVRLLSGSIGLCVAMHMGLNLAALICGVPAARFSPPPWESLLLTLVLSAVAITLARRMRGDVGIPSWPPEVAHD